MKWSRQKKKKKVNFCQGTARQWQRIDKQSKEVQKLRIATAMQANGVELESGDFHSHLKGIMDEMTEKVHDEHPDALDTYFGSNKLQLWKLSSCGGIWL